MNLIIKRSTGGSHIQKQGDTWVLRCDASTQVSRSGYALARGVQETAELALALCRQDKERPDPTPLRLRTDPTEHLQPAYNSHQQQFHFYGVTRIPRASGIVSGQKTALDINTIY